jgi:hypothetical protein
MPATAADPRALHVLLVEDDPGDVLLAKLITHIHRDHGAGPGADGEAAGAWFSSWPANRR